MTPDTPDAPAEQVQARAKATLPRSLILFLIASLAMIAFVAIALRVVEGHADAFDRHWALAIHDLDTPFRDRVMIAFTTIGSGPCLYGAIAVVSLLALRRGFWPLSVILLANALLALVTNALLKNWFVRARPTLFDEITRPETWSFPSGHSMSAMAVYGAIAAVLIALHRRWRWLIVTIATILIAGIGTSRVYLGVHWPFDVLAGYAASVPFVVVTVHLVHRLTRRLRDPAP